MKNILITQSVSHSKKRGYQYFLSRDWYEYAEKLNFNIIPYSYKLNNSLIKNLNISAIIFSGGNDLSSFRNKKSNYFRDLNEKKLLKFALKKKIQILGICRGFQLIADTLSKKTRITKKSKHIRIYHNLNVTNSKFIKNCKLKVNSYHSYCIENLDRNFNIISRLKDGSIEIAEAINNKIVFFMFHPERKNFSQKKIDTYIKKFLKI